MSFDTDVLVIGAGPAGATAARTLAAAGARVRLIDRARFPRPKPCGGAISMRALGRFPYVASALDGIPTHRASRLYLEGPGGGSVTIESPEPAVLLIRRVDYDHLLVRLAVEAGADLLEGVEIVHATMHPDAIELRTRSGQMLRAPLAIAADGVNSVVARRLGLKGGWARNAVAIDMMEEAPVEMLRCRDPDALWVAYGYGSGHGYAYVFPKQQHVNIGIGYRLDYFREAMSSPPYGLQRRLVDTLRHRRELEGESRRENFTPFLIPLAGPLRRTVCGRVLLTGDAGGFVNGFTAEGIYYAMVSGDLAGRAAVQALGQGAATPRLGSGARAALAGYERAWRREIGMELADSIVVQRFLFADPGRIDGMVRGARRRPHMAAALVAHAMGRLPYRVLRRRVLLRFPVVALGLATTWAKGLVALARPRARPE